MLGINVFNPLISLGVILAFTFVMFAIAVSEFNLAD